MSVQSILVGWNHEEGVDVTEKELDPVEETQTQEESPEEFEVDAREERRVRIAKAFGWFGFILLVGWAAYYFKDRFPLKMELRYVYKRAADLDRLAKVESNIYSHKGRWRAKVVFLHHRSLLRKDAPSYQTQKLELRKGDYIAKVKLTYKDGSKRRFKQRFFVKEEGRIYLYLRYAR
tara:strand:+ start:1088 stop:1618 length:531 start_codon:yes stop_codon:yes gene_type:complete